MDRCIRMVLLLVVAACGASGASTQAAPEDPGWPREYKGNGGSGGTLLVFQPQIEAWVDLVRLEFRAAISITPEGADAPILGAIWVEADTQTSIDTRTVLMGNLRIASGRF